MDPAHLMHIAHSASGTYSGITSHKSHEGGVGDNGEEIYHPNGMHISSNNAASTIITTQRKTTTIVHETWFMVLVIFILTTILILTATIMIFFKRRHQTTKELNHINDGKFILILIALIVKLLNTILTMTCYPF